MNISTALEHTALRGANIVAGMSGIDRDITWVHIVDHPDIAAWVEPGHLLLSTGYNWPKDDAQQRAMIRSLSERGLAGVVLAVPKFLTHFPDASREEANDVGLPLLELDWDVPFSAITEHIHSSIIRCQSELIQRSYEIHRALTNAALTANTLSDLACALGELLDRAVNFVDPDGLLLGTSERKTSDADVSARERSYMRLLHNRIILRRIQDSVDPILVEAQGEVGVPRRLGCPIRIRGEIAAIVFVDEGDCELGELDIRATEHASIIAALHLAHMRALHLQEERLGYALVGTLLEGKFEETPSALERARLSGWDPAGNYRVCLVLLDEPLPLSREGFLRRERWVERLRKYLEGIEQPLLVLVSLNQITFFLQSHHEPEPLWRVLGSRGAALAVSREHSGVIGMARGGEDVQSLLPLLKPGKVHHFHEVMFPRALMGDPGARELFVDSRIGPLLADKKGEALMETVEALCAEGFQLANTARRLGVHISTLRYRVERIESMLGTTLERQDSRFEIQVAVALHKIISER
ncbi:PucR family transcriptional regulator [Pandoraea sp. ISTKB]|uniref:PucR family transcriptional regulator n=1 Tax=Pandoraea sp. ISTKB TaxID=1586708 RepID=UPI000847255D|nr:PucR family transcriptional regulator [Pandoraea sp. ISTKB]ODP31087.1 CdaR family transcriptional regulator [Pandoraea sp. ISTKB]